MQYGEKNRVTKISLPRIAFPVWVATLALNILGLALPLAVLQIFGRVIPFQATDTLFVMLTGLLIVVFLEFSLREIRARILQHRAADLSGQLNKSLCQKQLFADPLDLVQTSRRRRLLQMQAGTKVAEIASGTARLNLIELPFAVLAIAGIALIAGPLVFVPLTGLVLLVVAATALRIWQREILENRIEADEERYDFWGDVLTNITGVKAAQMEAGLRGKYQDLQGKSSKASLDVIRSANLFENFATVAGYSFASATVLAGAFMVIKGFIGPAELAACTMLSTRAVQPCLQLVRHWASSASSKAPLADVGTGLSTPTIHIPDEHSTRRLRGEIELNNVTTRATKSGRATLRNQSFRIEPGSFTKLSGVSRSGPEAVMQLLMGEIVPVEGNLTLDGQNPRNLMHMRGTNGIVFVSHTPVILNATIIENIAGVIQSGNIKRAYEAADRVGITDFVNTLPFGFDTHMRESGMHESSTGFLQLVSIARAIAQDPAILLMSDSCSKLDETMQSRVATALSELSKDISVIAYDSAGILDRAVETKIEVSKPRARQENRDTPQKSMEIEDSSNLDAVA